jgi:hypothetical protein
VLEYCDDAPLHAAMNADRELEKGDIDRHQFWRAVIGALKEMGRRVPVAGERLK